MEKLEIGQKLWHPLSLDIIPHKIISITEYEDKTIYTSKALGKVGACGEVEVELIIDRKGTIRFIGLAKDYEYDGGLQDFVEGQYFTLEADARRKYYDIQKTLAWANMDNKERIYKEAKVSYDRCVQILKELNDKE